MDIKNSVLRQFSVSDKYNLASKYALILLDSKDDTIDEEYMNLMLENAAWFAVVDGGANRLRNMRIKYKNGMGEPFPDIISGDFDSVRNDTLEYFSDNGVEIIRTEDQSKTDLVKCIEILAERSSLHSKFQSVIILPSLHGRIDHVFGNINALFVARHLIFSKPTFLLAGNKDREQSVCLLSPGSTRVDVKHLTQRKGSCGLIPISGQCHSVTTHGLKWNVTNETLSFGGLVSTSNRLDDEAEFVDIETDSELLWSIDV